MSGAVLGVVLAQPLSRLLVASLSTSQTSIHLSIITDWRVLLFAAGVAVLTCIVFGTFPAMRGTSVDPIASLKSGERGIAGSRERFSVQRLLVVTQIAVSMVLLVGALLFVRSYRNLMTSIRHSRKRHHCCLFRLSDDEDQAGKRSGIQAAARGGCAQRAGVQNAAATTNVPLSGGTWSHGVHVVRRRRQSASPMRARVTLPRWAFRY